MTCELSHFVATLALTVPIVSTLWNTSDPFINHNPLTPVVLIQIEFGFIVCVTRAAHATAELEETREHLFHVPTIHQVSVWTTIGVLFGDFGEDATSEFVTDPCHILAMDRVAVSVDLTKEIVGLKYFSRHGYKKELGSYLVNFAEPMRFKFSEPMRFKFSHSFLDFPTHFLGPWFGSLRGRFYGIFYCMILRYRVHRIKSFQILIQCLLKTR